MGWRSKRQRHLLTLEYHPYQLVFITPQTLHCSPCWNLISWNIWKVGEQGLFERGLGINLGAIRQRCCKEKKHGGSWRCNCWSSIASVWSCVDSRRKVPIFFLQLFKLFSRYWLTSVQFLSQGAVVFARTKPRFDSVCLCTGVSDLYYFVAHCVLFSYSVINWIISFSVHLKGHNAEINEVVSAKRVIQ